MRFFMLFMGRRLCLRRRSHREIRDNGRKKTEKDLGLGALWKTRVIEI